MSSHLFLVLSSYTLPRGTLKTISKGLYSIEELDEIFEFVKSEYRRYRKNLRVTMGIVLLCMAFVLSLGVFTGHHMKMEVFLGIVLMYVIILILIFLVIYVQKVNKIRKTFLVAIEKGYPELYNTYQRELYEYVD